MKYVTKPILIIFVFLIASCGGGEETSSNTLSQTSKNAESAPSVDRKQQLVLTIRGAEDLDWNYSGLYGCKDDLVTVFSMSHTPKVQLTLPRGVSVGEYPLVDYNASSPSGTSLSILGAMNQARRDAGSTRGTNYYKYRSGSLTIETIPEQRGDFFKARFIGELESSKGEVAEVDLKMQVEDTGYCLPSS